MGSVHKGQRGPLVPSDPLNVLWYLGGEQEGEDKENGKGIDKEKGERRKTGKKRRSGTG